MKGVIAGRTNVPVHDLTHDIAAFDVFEAAWFLRCVEQYWPAGTIFVCVVDPGVGTRRDILAIERDGKVFLAPDNGLLTFVGASRAVRVTSESLFLPNGSTTFHGRDRFAPVAAALANGFPLSDLGPAVDSIVTLPYKPPVYGERTRGSIVAIDRFGNAITDLEMSRVERRPFLLRVRDLTIERLETNYADAAPGAFLIVGSMGTIEISVAGASAAERLQLRRLERVELVPQNV